ncbi:MAG: hypothetical protein KC457_26820 [Myxococcales bacterium]|nr:hypothetical protein [Myxococcales bacterium]
MSAMQSPVFRLASLALAAGLGVIVGACAHSDFRIEKVCKDYCARLVDCNDNTDFDDCVDNCVDTASDCDTDKDVEQALDTLEQCASEACNNVFGCSVDAWLECAI